MKNFTRNWLTACIFGGVLALTSFTSGCRSAQPAKTEIAVRNPDGSITNPDGSVTYPVGVKPPASSMAPATPAVGAPTSPSGSAVQPGLAPSSLRSRADVERERNREIAAGTSALNSTGPDLNAPNGPPPAYGPPSGSAPSGSTPTYDRRASGNYPVRMVVPAGTAVSVRLNNGLAASRNNVGDRWTGSLNSPLQTASGATVFASGTPVAGQVVAAKGRGRFKGAGDLGIQLTAIGRESVSSTEYETVSKGRGKRTLGFGAGGAGLGALIGGLAGGGKGALIGGLAGAGAGTAAGAYTGKRDVVIPAESVVRFRLTSSLGR